MGGNITSLARDAPVAAPRTFDRRFNRLFHHPRASPPIERFERKPAAEINPFGELS